MSKTMVVSGVDSAYVNTSRGVRMFREGETVDTAVLAPGPDGGDELERLNGLNVFGEHPRVQAKRDLDLLVEAGLASLGVAIPDSMGVVQQRAADDDADDPAPGSEAFAKLPRAALESYAEANSIDLSGLPKRANKSAVVEAIEAAIASEE